MAEMTLEDLAKLPVEIEKKVDDGAYDEPHIETSYSYGFAIEVFDGKQLERLLEHKDIDSLGPFFIEDYTYFSTLGSVYARVEVFASFGDRKRRIAQKEYHGKRIHVDYKDLEFEIE